MNIRFKHYLLTLVCIVLFISESSFAKNILILNSYHQTLSWTDNLVKNIIKGLPDEKHFIEYMDTKRFNRVKIFKIFKDYIREKYQNIKLDLVIVTDNNALTFVVSNKTVLFKNIPVLFCGINNFSFRMLKNYHDITGVVEGVDIKGTLDAMLMIHPNVKNVVALMGANFTSQIYFYKIVKLQYQYRNKINIIIYNGLFYNKEDYTKELQNLPENSIILYLNLFKLRDGTIFGIKDGLEYIFNNTHKPIYGMWDVIVDFTGVVGGKITSSRLQALSVVNYAKKILYNNVPAERLPVITKSPSEYIFDYRELKRFKIDFNRLPKPYKLINEPPKIYKKLKQKEKVLFYLKMFLIILAILIVLLVYNIRKRKIAEEQLESENLQFLTLLNSTNDLIILKSTEGKWIYANKMAEEFLSIKDTEYKDKLSEEVLKYIPFKVETANSFIKDELVWENKKAVRKIVTFKRDDGEVFYMDVIKIPVFNKDGSERCIIVTARDITDLKKMQENIIISQKMDIVGKFAGGIAHDFNNILTTITTNAELCLMMIESNSKLAKHIKNIVSAAEKSANLIRQLLAFARKDLGSKDIVEINNSVKSIIKILKPSIPENINFSVVPYHELSYIYADPVQIEQIITNLVFNAKDSVIEKNSSEKFIKVSIEKVLIDSNFLKNINVDAKEGEYVLISVQDNGTGIEEVVLEKIFDPFFTTKADGKGTGLGLTTVFNLIEKNNGFLLVDTKIGVGSTFKIYFPTVKATNEINNKNTENIIRTNKKFELNILFVEDDIGILNSAKESLTNIFKNVILAKNGKEAIDKVRGMEDEIDILVTDIVMPVMDGVELAKRLKYMNKDIKVIFVSGYDSGKLQRKLHFDYKFLYKPYNFETLLKVIEEQF